MTPHRLLAAALLAVSLLVPSSAAMAVEAEADPRPSTVTKAERTYADRVFHWTNVARRNHDLPPYRRLPCLRGIAQRWSERMARSGRFEHQDLSVIGERCERVYSAGENIAYHYDSPRAMVRMWMNSEGHRANILSTSFTHLGVGTAMTDGRWYGTQDFAGR